MVTDTERLEQAEQAYHDLMTGKSVVQFRDSNGEVIQYNQQSAGKLLQYIFILKQRLGVATGLGPMRTYF